jgi:TRAP-type C4-dicarboxylate transport system permease small subunit
MRRTLDTVYSASLALAGAFLLGIFALMVLEPVFRWLGSYITGANELIGWFCAAAGFLALPATFKRGDMIRVGMLVDRLPPPVRKPILLACFAIAIVFVSFMVWAAAFYLWDGWRAQETTQGMLVIPVWIPQLSFLVGAVLLLVAVLDEAVSALAMPAASLVAEKPVAH